MTIATISGSQYAVYQVNCIFLSLIFKQFEVLDATLRNIIPFLLSSAFNSENMQFFTRALI